MELRLCKMDSLVGMGEYNPDLRTCLPVVQEYHYKLLHAWLHQVPHIRSHQHRGVSIYELVFRHTQFVLPFIRPAPPPGEYCEHSQIMWMVLMHGRMMTANRGFG